MSQQKDARKVACERADGLLNVHPEFETCDVCRAPAEREGWAAGLKPNTCGMKMLHQARAAPCRLIEELYNIATDKRESELVRGLAAQLYVARSERDHYRSQLYLADRWGSRPTDPEG
jgi:hypothetical protein